MDFSNVLKESQEAMSIKYNMMVYELQREGKKVTVLSLGEAFFDIPLFSFDKLKFPDLYHYSSSRGILGLREKLAKFFFERYEIPIDPEHEILITAGSKAAIHFSLMAILNPGDEVLVPEPYWVSYPEQIKLCYGQPICIPYDVKIFDYENFINSKTKAIIVNNPHNPTGYVYKREELEFLLKLAKKYNLWVLSDEAYSEFVPEDKFISLGSLDIAKKHSIVFNSISKNYGISGWRLGYVIGNKELINNVLKVNQHLITCPATILEYYVDAYFYDILSYTEPQIKNLLKKRRLISDYMDEIGLKRLDGDATFYFFVSISPSFYTSEEFCMELLKKFHISTVPGAGYGKSCDQFIRVSIGTVPLDELKFSLDLIKSLIEKTSPEKIKNQGKILIVAGGKWQAPIIKFWKKEQFDVWVVDPYKTSPGALLADKQIEIDVKDYNKIIKAVGSEKFDFIVTDQSDISVMTVAFLNEYFGLAGNSPAIVEKFLNKVKMREFAASIGVPCPKFREIKTIQELKSFRKELKGPLMLKPADSQSSRGIFKIDNSNCLHEEDFFAEAKKFSNCGSLIAEEFLEGIELTVEGLAIDKRHRTLAVSQKKHFRTGIASELRYPAALPKDVLDRLVVLNDSFVEKSGLNIGITHAEYMYNPNSGDLNLVEIACRGGGTLISSNIIELVSGVAPYDLLHDALNGRKPDVKKLNLLNRSAILKFFEFPSGKVKTILGVDKASCLKGVDSLQLEFSPGDFLKPAGDDRSRQGFFIASAENEKELEEVICQVISTIEVTYE